MALLDRSEEQSYNPIDQINSGNVVVNSPKKPTTDELIAKFYSTREPAPIFDQAKADRIQRMGKINQIGQGAKVLGDLFGSALGANTRRRQPDQTAPALYNSYQNMLDRYEGQKEAFNYRDFQTKRDNFRFGIGQAHQEDQMNLAAQKQKDWMRAKEADNKLNFGKWNAEYGLKKDNAKETARKNREMADIARIRANKTGSKTGSETKDKPYMQVGTQSLTEGETRQIFDEALSYYNGGKSVGLEGTQNTYLKGMLAAYSNQPTETKKEIVAHYLRDEQRQLDQQRQKQGISTGTVQKDMAKPKTPIKTVAPKRTYTF